MMLFVVSCDSSVCGWLSLFSVHIMSAYWISLFTILGCDCIDPIAIIVFVPSVG